MFFIHHRDFNEPPEEKAKLNENDIGMLRAVLNNSFKHLSVQSTVGAVEYWWVRLPPMSVLVMTLNHLMVGL